jgi:hypothetical protein
MRIISTLRLSMLAIVAITFFSCNEKEEFISDKKVSDYLPLTVGKYITYRIDSLVFTNFGRSSEIHRYQVKHVIDAQITDNLGRPSYRVYKFIRDSVGIQPWVSNGSYFITPVSTQLELDQLELIEDNLRFIKMHLPIKDGFSWKGNRYLPTDPYGSKYFFSNDDNMENWDFNYDGGISSFSYRSNNYADVLTVEQVDDATNAPVTNTSLYGSKNRSVEKYAKNIGLVYREHTLWEYQPNTGGSGGGYQTGFGITQWMIDHN